MAGFAVMGLALAGSMVGCGTENGDDEPNVTTTIPGSTNTIGLGDDTSDETTDAAPTEPGETTSAATGDIATADDLFARVGAAMSEFQTVHLTVGNETTPAVEADHQYLEGNDYVAEVLVMPDMPIEALRVDKVFYLQVGADGPYEEILPADVPTGPDAGIPGAFPTWDVLGDLVALLQNADDFEAGGPTDVDGESVESYSFTVDADAIVAGAQVPDLITGTVEVAFSIDEDGLPVRVDETFDDGTVLRTDYSDWGVTVDAQVPDDIE